MNRSFVESELKKIRKQLALATQGLRTVSQIVQAEPREDPAAAAPSPQQRGCPWCGKIIMAAASRCGYCWRKVEPSAMA